MLALCLVLAWSTGIITHRLSRRAYETSKPKHLLYACLLQMCFFFFHLSLYWKRKRNSALGKMVSEVSIPQCYPWQCGKDLLGTTEFSLAAEVVVGMLSV